MAIASNVAARNGTDLDKGFEFMGFQAPNQVWAAQDALAEVKHHIKL